MSESTPRNYKAVVIVFIIVILFPFGFYSYFEYRKQNNGDQIKVLPVLSLDSIPEFSFTSQTGQTINRDSMIGRITVADFFFSTCPGICPRMSRQMHRLQEYLYKNKNIKSETRLISHTVNPSTDSVARLHEYADIYEADSSKWWIVTGDKKELYDLSKNFYKLPAIDMSEDSTLAEPFVHSERFVLLDKEGFIRGYYDGTDSMEVRDLMIDLVYLDIQYQLEERRLTKKNDE